MKPVLPDYPKSNKITALHKITALYRQWAMKRLVVMQTNDGEANERLLFHGTGVTSPKEVVANAHGNKQHQILDMSECFGPLLLLPSLSSP